MMIRLLCTTAAITLFVPATLQAATVTTVLNYSATNVGLDGGTAVGFNRFTTADVGIATLRFGAEASAGDVDAAGSIRFNAEFDDSVTLADASAVSLRMGVESLTFGYEAFTGAEAGAFVNFDSFAGINPPEFRVIGDDYRLDTADSRNGFGSTGNERALRELAGVGPNVSLGLGVRAQVTLDASQTTSMSVSALEGTILATHSSGATRTSAFSLVSNASEALDLTLAGEWSLALQNVRLRNQFDSATGISAGYELGLAAGELFGGCGDYSIDSDNENSLVPLRACVADTGVSGDTSQLNLLNPDPFELAWGNRFVNLGTISVLAPTPPPPVAAVPLPAGMPLILAGLLGFAGMRVVRRQTTA